MFDLFLSCAKVNISCSLQLPKNLLEKYILAPIMNYILFLAKNHGRPSVSSVSERPKSNVTLKWLLGPKPGSDIQT